MTKYLLSIILAASLLMGVEISVQANPIVEVNSIDFNQVGVTYSNGTLHVTGASGLVVSVYNIVGQKVYECKIDSNDKRIELSLPSNCYIVKVGQVARKISVRR